MPTVLVTGASGGIGLSIAKRYATEGYDIILVARSKARLEAVAADLSSVRVDIFAADLAAPDGPTTLAEQVGQAGLAVEILVNNAGAGLHGPFSTTPIARELELVQLNVASLLQLTKWVLPGMRERGRGHIVNVASVAAFLPGPYQAVYYATKAFVLSFSEALAEELKNSGIGVTAVCPGPTRTGFHDAANVRRARPFRPSDYLSADAVADATVAAVRGRRRVVVPGLRKQLLVAALRLAPRRLVAWVSGRVSEPAAP